MANSPHWSNGQLKTNLDTLCALLNNGFLEIFTGAQPAYDAANTGSKIAKLTFGATAFAGSSASGGTVTATANAIASDTNAVGGTAGYFALMKSDDSTIVATGSVGTSGADLNLNSLTISAGATVSCSSFTVTQPQQ